MFKHSSRCESARVLTSALSGKDGCGRKRRTAVALASAVASLAALLVPVAARAQCNRSANPALPSAPAQTNFSNQSFGAAPLPQYYLSASGQAGCKGADDGSWNGKGQDGFAGQSGGSFNSVNSGITMKGGFAPTPISPTMGAGWSVNGGDGGAGGQGGYDDDGSAHTGNGGAAGNGGAVSVQFSGTVGPDPKRVLPEVALDVEANGGTGGVGAVSNAQGIQPLYGGNGGPGGGVVRQRLTPPAIFSSMASACKRPPWAGPAGKVATRPLRVILSWKAMEARAAMAAPAVPRHLRIRTAV